MIERSGFCELGAAYACAEDALEELALNSPDVLLMDIHLPGISGVECVNRIRAIDFKGARPEIVMLTVYEESQKIFDSLQAGVTGYLLKRAEEVLSLVAHGYINKEIADMTGLSVETVRSYLKNIYKKLHVRSRTAAAMKYFS